MSSGVRTSAIVVTLNPGPEAADALLSWLADDARVATGQLNDGRLPLSFQCDRRDEERGFWRALNAHPSVGLTHLIFVHEEPS